MHKEEIAVLFSFRQLQRFPLIDPVRIADNITFLRLPVDMRKPFDRNYFAQQHVSKDIACTDRRKLILITQHNQSHPRSQSVQQM